MIRINLAPPSSLTDKIWFVPEVLLFALVLSLSWTGAEWFLGSIENTRDKIQEETKEIVQDIAKLHGDVEKFEQMRKQIAGLKDKLSSLESITISKVDRYLPIILLDFLQTMRPEGLWFKTLIQNSDDHQISIEGGSFDNLLISEFMTTLEDTKKRAIDMKDVRSNIYFSHVVLERISSNTDKDAGSNQNTGNETETQKAFKKTEEVKRSKKEDKPEDNSFPELSKFPVFSLTLKYAERNKELPNPPKALKKRKL